MWHLLLYAVSQKNATLVLEITMANVDHFFILTGDLAVANGSHPASDNSPSGRICTRVECLLCQTTHTVTRKTTEAATTLRPIAARRHASSSLEIAPICQLLVLDFGNIRSKPVLLC